MWVGGVVLASPGPAVCGSLDHHLEVAMAPNPGICILPVKVHFTDRKPLRVERILLCSGPETTRRGDVIALLSGVSAPMVLRPHEDCTFRVVGAAFANIGLLKRLLSGLRWRTISLV
jgi:hypothetical protein